MEPTNKLPRRVAAIAYLVICVACGYVIVTATITVLTTGTLKVSSSNKKATLTISQSNSEAVIIGTGEAKVRLKPGSYLVASSGGGKQAVSVTEVGKNKTATVLLDPSSNSTLPSVGNISFIGLDVFTSHGLSETQLASLKQAFFNFQPSAKSVVVYPNSLKPGARDPNTDAGFSISFITVVDSKTYNAIIYYHDLNNVQLTIRTTDDGALIYDSNSSSH